MAAANSAEVEKLALGAGMKKGGAAKGELVLAMYELANCFRNGWGIKKDPAAAKQYYETAANLGDTDAMNEVAWCYTEGFGTKKDKVSKPCRLSSAQLWPSCSARLRHRSMSTRLEVHAIATRTVSPEVLYSLDLSHHAQYALRHDFPSLSRLIVWAALIVFGLSGRYANCASPVQSGSVSAPRGIQREQDVRQHMVSPIDSLLHPLLYRARRARICRTEDHLDAVWMEHMVVTTSSHHDLHPRDPVPAGVASSINPQHQATIATRQDPTIQRTALLSASADRFQRASAKHNRLALDAPF